QTIVDRTVAAQKATILIDGSYTTSPTIGLGPVNDVYDLSVPNSQTLNTATVAHTVAVQANAGDLTIETRGNAFTWGVSVVSNSGNLTFDSQQTWNGNQTSYDIAANTGTLNIDSVIVGSVNTNKLVNGVSQVVNVRGNSGTINIENDVNGLLSRSGINVQL